MEDVKAPSFQMYPKDALDIKVTRMSDAAQGVYWRLLWNIWAHTKTQFSIEKNEKTLKNILGLSSGKLKKYFKEIQHNGDPIFIETETEYLSKRLRIEKLKQIEWRKKSSIGGKHSAKKRARVVQPPLQPKRQPKGNTSFASSTSSSTVKKKNTLSAKKQQTVPEVKLFIDAWFIAYLKKFGEKYNVSGGKEGNLIKTLIGKYGYDKLKKLANAFWESDDPFIVNSDYGISVFYSQINKLNTSNRKSPNKGLAYG